MPQTSSAPRLELPAGDAGENSGPGKTSASAAGPGKRSRCRRGSWRLVAVSIGVRLAALLAVLPGPLAWAEDPTTPETRAPQLEIPQFEIPREVDFRREVRPILSEKCFACHGPDAANRKGRLQLHERETARRVLEPGAGGELPELLRRIESEDPDERMPPPEAKRTVEPEEREILRRWIESGAPYTRHWSFEPIRRADDSRVKLPPSWQPWEAWARDPIDRLVLAGLVAAGVPPAGEAAPEDLLRRVFFDLTGLPPDLEELDRLLPGLRSPTREARDLAFQDIVRELLSREAYAERMTAEWLDVARYSDSYGYQVDRDRFVWPWRDWVLRAFRDNLPYDRFLELQIAGDLLPDATDDDILATTFNRLHPQKVEGGSVPEEFRVEYVADRTNTFATAVLGLTYECAKCHSHKFDPITQTDYYRLFAYFDRIDEAGLYSYFTPAVPTPTLRLFDDATRARLREAEQAVTAAEARVRARFERPGEGFDAWLASPDRAPGVDVEPAGRLLKLDFEGSGAGANTLVEGKIGRAVRLTGDDPVNTSVGNFHRYDPFTIALWLQVPRTYDRAVVFHRSRAWTDAGSRGYELLIEDGRLSAALIHFDPGNSLRVRSKAPLAVGEWKHVTVRYDGSSRARGLELFVDGEPIDVEIVRDHLEKHITGGGGDTIAIGERFRDRGLKGGLVDEFEVFDRALGEIEILARFDPARADRALHAPVESLGAPDRERLLSHWARLHDAELHEALESLRSARKAKCAIEDGLNEIMVMRDLPDVRTTHRLRRGAYDAPEEPVTPGTPSALPPQPDDAPPNRLGLARWALDPQHPLTARVAVNRVWQMLFGHGLVRTPEDFGSQGEPPTHPEVLDTLARDFIDSGWDLKALVARIVSSSTYRQSSRVPRELFARDPRNRLLARGPSHRLSSEMLRDNALAVSGLLSKTFGGPPAKPYDLADSFKPMSPDKGEGLYRRSVYTFWKRTAPAPVMMVLDAAKRDVCTVKRERTSSPLQALVLLNSPQLVEASRVLAERLVRKHSHAEAGATLLDESALTTEAFRLLTSRVPDARERPILSEMLAEELRLFGEDEPRALELLSVGGRPRDETLPAARVAAVTVLVNTLFNFDGCTNKR